MRDIGYSLSASIFSRGAMLFLTLISVKFLSTNQYGHFAYYLSIVSSVAVVSVMGAGTTVNIYLARYGSSNLALAKNIVLSSLLLASALSFIIGAFVTLLFPFHDVAQYKIADVLFVCTVLFIAISAVMEGALNGLKRYKNLLIISVITFVFAVCSALFLVPIYGVIGAIVSLLLYRILYFALSSRTLKRAGVLSASWQNPFVPEVLAAFKSISLPTMLSGLMVGPTLAIALSLAKAYPSGLTGIAYFSWVQQLYLVAVFIPSSLAGYFITRIVHSGSRSAVGEIMKANLLFSVITAFLFYLVKPWMLAYAGFADSRQAQFIYDMMALTIILYCINAGFASYWPTANRGWVGFAVNFLWAFVFLASVKLNLPTYGAAAISMGYVIAYLIQFFVQCIIYGIVKDATD